MVACTALSTLIACAKSPSKSPDVPIADETVKNTKVCKPATCRFADFTQQNWLSFVGSIEAQPPDSVDKPQAYAAARTAIALAYQLNDFSTFNEQELEFVAQLNSKIYLPGYKTLVLRPHLRPQVLKTLKDLVPVRKDSK
ncbi:MAG: hypothetical protein HRT45_12100 [Bdellovibrionales bacterium]|nr:hypothetical protein [Bdellovibrionales bacterium]